MPRGALITTGEAAEILGVDARTVRQWGYDGVLVPRLTPGGQMRFTRAEILAYSEGTRMGIRRERGAWFVQFRYVDPITGEPGRVHERSLVQTKRGAEQHERNIRAQIAAGTYGKQATPTLKAFVPEFLTWLDVSNAKPSYRAACESALERHLIPAMGSLKLSAIDAGVIDAFKARQKIAEHQHQKRKIAKRGLSEKTINNHLGVLHKLLEVAVEYGKLKDAPGARLYRPKKPNQADYRWLSESEADKLLAATTGRLRTMITVALYSGLRLGELIALQWDDLEAGQIRVRRQWCQIKKDFTFPKSDAGTRDVPIHPRIAAALKRCPRRLHCPLIFSTSSGRVVLKSELGRSLARACSRAQIEPIGWHGLRHTFASWLVSRGISLYEVQRLLGHSTVQMTERYAHLAPSTLARAIEAL